MLNLAHEDVFALTTALVTSTIIILGVQRNWPPLQLAGTLNPVWRAAAGFGVLLSLFVERAACKRFRGRSCLAPVIASLGLAFILFQGALVWHALQGSWIPGKHRSMPGLPEVPTAGIPDLLPQTPSHQSCGDQRAYHLPRQRPDHSHRLSGLCPRDHLLIQRTATGRMRRARAENPLLAESVGINWDGGIAHCLSGDDLAIATLTLGLLAQRVIVNLRGLTDGSNGIGTMPPPSLLGFKLANPLAQYYLVFIVVVLTAFAARHLMDSRTGHAWLARSEDETAAGAFGVTTRAYRILGLVMTSTLAGLAGALYATTLGYYVDPDIVSFHIATLTLTLVMLGGVGSVTGARLGVLLIIDYDKVIITQAADFIARFWPKNTFIGSVPDIRGTNFFNFGIALDLAILIRACRKQNCVIIFFYKECLP